MQPEESLTVAQSGGLLMPGENELATAGAMAKEQAEIQAAIVVAKRFPRNELQVIQSLMTSCRRTSFAEKAEYKYPRGNQTVSGPSIYFAREAARLWGNIRFGVHVVRDDEDSRQLQGWAWDLETNTKIVAEDHFKKQVFRKYKDGREGGQYIKAEDRELRELTNKCAAFLVRNCLLQMLPADIVQDAIATARETVKEKAKQDPAGERKKVVAAFAQINVTVLGLEKYLGHPLAECSPSEIADLRGIYKSISEGNSKWSDYVGGTKEDTEALKERVAADAARLKAKAAQVAQASEPTPLAEMLPELVEPETVADLCDGIVLKLTRLGISHAEIEHNARTVMPDFSLRGLFSLPEEPLKPVCEKLAAWLDEETAKANAPAQKGKKK